MLDRISRYASPRAPDDAVHPAGTTERLEPLDVVGRLVDARLSTFFGDRRGDVPEAPAAIEVLVRAVETLHRAGGKRLRPAFVAWGNVAAGGAIDPCVVDVAAATELLHDFALLHDDVMDRSSTRRGLPTAHVALRAEHARPHDDDAAWFGISAAVLAGDLAFVWADRLFDGVGSDLVPPHCARRARELFTTMRTEVIAGQYLDLCLGADEATIELDGANVALLKSARYTVTRPLQIGAALAGADDELCARLSGYGDAVGTAFQLRDDVLGLFGDPQITGKSCTDDLREGKRNVLVLSALRMADDRGRAVLQRSLGAPDVGPAAVEGCREVVVESGALAEVESMIRSHLHHALGLAGTFDPRSTAALEQLACYAAQRDR
jgi:geranylgeranyl diphosphate synthase type I